MSDLSPEGLAAIRQRADAATPGPWEFDSADSGHSQYEMDVWVNTVDIGDHVCSMDGLLRCGNERDARDDGYADAEFIAAARTDVPALLAELSRVTAQHAETVRELESVRASRDALIAGVNEVIGDTEGEWPEWSWPAKLRRLCVTAVSGEDTTGGEADEER